MESPETSKKKLIEEETFMNSLNSSTPTNQRLMKDEFSLYLLHNESSPNFRAGQEVMEIGWGDSPEPISRDSSHTIFSATRTPVMCKKKLEQKESPTSSILSKKRYIRSNLRIHQKPQVDVSKYVAEVQELSKSVMKELNSNKLEENIHKHEHHLLNNNELFQNNSFSRVLSTSKRPSLECDSDKTLLPVNINFNAQTKESSFDNILEQFINEKDDWLSQALSTQEVKNCSPKINFIKSKSENELTWKQSTIIEIKCNTSNCNSNLKNKLQRTSSFEVTQPKKKLNISSNDKSMENNIQSLSLNTSKNIASRILTPQYSEQEIEKKRLEAIYRKEKKVIERKKMEALKRLEMKKLKIIQA